MIHFETESFKGRKAMDIKFTKDPESGWWKEFLGHDYFDLRALEADFKKRGVKTYFALFDACNGIWSLTVREA